MLTATDTTTHTDRTQLQQIAAGDEKAFARFFHTWYPLLLTQVQNVLKETARAEEIVQDVFLKLWMTRETLAEIQNIKAFLLVMARNKTFTELKKIAREKIKQQEWLSENNNTQEGEPEENKFLSLLDLAINHLPPQQQKVFVLSRRDRLKNAEIAAQTGLSLETVKKYLQRAVESITRFLQEHYPMLVPILPVLLWH